MDDDSPPRIAILGAGPIGLEAALYARYLGYPVEQFERNKLPAEHILDAGDLVLRRFGDHASPLGMAALAAQDSAWQPPEGSAEISAAEHHRRYLVPLAESDLLSDSLRLETEVQSIHRGKDDVWRINCKIPPEVQVQIDADIVLDVTGIAGATFVRNESVEEDPQDEMSFKNPTADFYVLGSKSSPGNQSFSFAEGLAQIRELFAILGERDDLDIYATMPPVAD